MQALVCDPEQVETLINRRREAGADRYDEVWDGLYVMSLMPSLEHQRLVGEFTSLLNEVISRTGRGVVYPGANVTDCEEDWDENYRCPNVVVVLKGSARRCRDIELALLGGPDFLIEVRSPGDKTLDKLDFYSFLGVRELLVVDRDTKAMTLFRLTKDRLRKVGPVAGWIKSETVGLAFRRWSGGEIKVRTVSAPQRSWTF